MTAELETLSLLQRQRGLFTRDLQAAEAELGLRVRDGSFLVLGGAGSIGQAVVRALFARSPKLLHVIDISENNLVELVRDLRSSFGYIEGDFQALPLDVGQPEFQAFAERSKGYDYILNLSALKHVRSEKDPYTLMRMLTVNVLNTEATLRMATEMGARRYFAVSSDKAANPANAMGATKRAMEYCLTRASDGLDVSSARFANVAFSDGSLLHGFGERLSKRQPIAAPTDVKRYFITDSEAATLCLLSCLVGNNRETFFPNPSDELAALDFRGIAERFLASRGYEAHACRTEAEARERVDELATERRWPCYFFESDTTGEKGLEEFYMAQEDVDLQRFEEVGVVRWPAFNSSDQLDQFLDSLRHLRAAGQWTRRELLNLLKDLLPEFDHQETGKFLDSRM